MNRVGRSDANRKSLLCHDFCVQRKGLDTTWTQPGVRFVCNRPCWTLKPLFGKRLWFASKIPMG